MISCRNRGQTKIRPENGPDRELRPVPAAPWPRLGGHLTWAYHCLRLTLAGVFIYAGFIKLLDPRAFAHAIAQYDLVPEALLPLVAIGLPALELLAGLGLIWKSGAVSPLSLFCFSCSW